MGLMTMMMRVCCCLTSSAGQSQLSRKVCLGLLHCGSLSHARPPGKPVRKATTVASDDEDDSDIDDDVHDQLLGALSQLDKRRVRAKGGLDANTPSPS